MPNPRSIDASEFQEGFRDGWQFGPLPKTLKVKRPDGKFEPAEATLDGERYHYDVTDPSLSTLLDTGSLIPEIKFSTTDPVIAEYIYFRETPPPGLTTEPFEPKSFD